MFPDTCWYRHISYVELVPKICLYLSVTSRILSYQLRNCMTILLSGWVGGWKLFAVKISTNTFEMLHRASALDGFFGSWWSSVIESYECFNGQSDSTKGRELSLLADPLLAPYCQWRSFECYGNVKEAAISSFKRTAIFVNRKQRRTWIKKTEFTDSLNIRRVRFLKANSLSLYVYNFICSQNITRRRAFPVVLCHST
jgi:hypothetical protein